MPLFSGTSPTLKNSWLHTFLVVKESCKNKTVCLKINAKQNIKLKRRSIKFKIYFEQLAVPFKIYADFESILKRIHSDDTNNNASYTKKHIFLAVLLTKLYVLIIDLASQLVFTGEKLHSTNLLKQFLKKMIIAKKW